LGLILRRNARHLLRYSRQLTLPNERGDLSPRRGVVIAVIDFHTHSAASDGALRARDLVARAADEGVTRFALTDHDTIAGYLSITQYVPHGLELVSGVELSCQWGRVGIHVIGLGFDESNADLLEHLAQLDAARVDRSARIAHRLEKAGMPGALEGALEIAAGAQIGRPHFARWMVASGYVDTEQDAFKRFLGRGKPGDISVLWPALHCSVEAIIQAGGVAVLAHPLEYKMTATRLRALRDAFCEAGGQAIEVINGRANPGDADQLWRLADERDLMVSVGSDFHRDTPYGAGLGVDVTAFPEGRGVWEVLCAA